MSLILANNVSVLSGTLRLEQYGIPTYDIVIDQIDASGFDAGTAVSIECNGGATFKGTVAEKRAGDFLDTIHVRIVGGKNGMGNVATPKGYAQPQALAKDVINDLLRTAGESLSDKSSTTIQNTNLTAWMTPQRIVSECLDVLLEYVAPNAGWRILPDGTVFIGEESWASSSDEYTLMLHDPVEARYDLGVDVPTIVPGVTLDGIGKVVIVEHRIKSDSIRSIVWVDIGVDRGEAESIRQIAKHALAKIDYFTTYDCTVKSQSGDLTTVDLNPPSDLKEIGGLQRVPLIHGLPGCKVQVPNGGTVSLGWYRGDPRRPYAALWPTNGGDGVTRLQIAGNTDAARKGDHADDGTLTLTVGGTATLAWVYVDPDGNTTSGASGTPITLKGKISEGSSKVGLG